MWLVALPALGFGAIGVLVPLRLDALGAATAAVGATFLVAAAVEGVISPLIGRVSDRHGRLRADPLRLLAAAVMMLLLPLPGTAVLVAVAVVVTTGRSARSGRRRWRCSPTPPRTPACTRDWPSRW